MSLITVDNRELDVIWSEEECDAQYTRGSHSLEGYEVFMLYKIKTDLHKVSKKGWKEFCDRNGVIKRTADSKIAYLVAQYELSEFSHNLLTWEIVKAIYNNPNIVREISYSNFEKLEGKSTKDKLDFYNEVKQHFNVEKPSRSQMTKYAKFKALPSEKLQRLDKYKELQKKIAKELILKIDEFSIIYPLVKGSNEVLEYYKALKIYIKAVKKITALELEIKAST